MKIIIAEKQKMSYREESRLDKLFQLSPALAVLYAKTLSGNWKDKSGNTLLHYSGMYHSPQLLDIALSKGININKQNNSGENVLSMALKSEKNLGYDFYDRQDSKKAKIVHGDDTPRGEKLVFNLEIIEKILHSGISQECIFYEPKKVGLKGEVTASKLIHPLNSLHEKIQAYLSNEQESQDVETAMNSYKSAYEMIRKFFPFNDYRDIRQLYYDTMHRMSHMNEIRIYEPVIEHENLFSSNDWLAGFIMLLGAVEKNIMQSWEERAIKKPKTIWSNVNSHMMIFGTTGQGKSMYGASNVMVHEDPVETMQGFFDSFSRNAAFDISLYESPMLLSWENALMQEENPDLVFPVKTPLDYFATGELSCAVKHSVMAQLLARKLPEKTLSRTKARKI